MRKILDVFEVFLGIFEKPKEKKDRGGGPTRNFHEKYRKKIPPEARNAGLPEFIHPPNTPKIAPILGFSGVFSGYFQNFGLGGDFFGIFRGNSGSGHLGALQQVGAFSSLRRGPGCLAARNLFSLNFCQDFGCGSDMARICLGCVVGCGSDVLSDVTEKSGRS